jgi:uncharacterized protein (TIGR02145 family)/uncharacterized repeat protein (TIGR02543 family)
MKRSSFLLLCLPLLFLCNYKGNIYDRDDPDYVPPSFTIDKDSSNLKDTIPDDTLRIILVGNDEERRHNRFRWSLDGGNWSKWDGDGKEKYKIIIANLSGGNHRLVIEVCYNPDEETADSTITFFKAVRPSITAMSDTAVAVDAQAACTLWVKAEGTGVLEYAWYRASVKLNSAISDSLLLTSVSLADTGVYYCRVTNAWGEKTSLKIRLRVLFRVFYDGNENTGGMAPVDTNGYAPGAIATTLGNPGNLSRRGYTFAGWNTKADASGNTRDSSDIFKMDTFNVTLYAKWAPNPSFTLSYDKNGATGGKLPDTARLYRTGALIAVAGNSGNLVKPGYTFTGWNTAADGSGKGYGENDPLEMGDEPIILYAQWSNNPTFTVTYDGNGAESGEVPTDSKKYEEGVTVMVAGNTGNLAKPGNTFTGWNTLPEGDSGTAYTPGSAFIMSTKNVTLYARWTAKPVYTLTYLGNGNTGGSAPEAISNEAGATITVAGAGTLVKKGHSFAAWNTEADGSGMSYAPNATFSISSRNDTLYAQWEINRYTVTYNGNGSDGGMVPPRTTHRYNTEVTLATETPTRTGHTFYRWNTSQTGDGEDYKPGDKFTIGDKNVTLYARWTVNRYTIAYRGNGNTAGNAPDSVTVDYNDSMKIAGKGDLARTGWSFTLWDTKADGSGTPYPADTTIIMAAGDLTLYAQWKVNGYTVIFDARGGIPAKTERAAQYGDTVTPPDVSRKGYSLKNWYRDSAYTAVWDFAADTVTGNMTLYARWTANSYTVAFDKNDPVATGSMAAQTITYAATVPLTLNSFSKTGWSFAGWATSVGGAVEYADSADYTMGAGDDTLYAKWTKNSYRLTYNANVATGGTVPAPTDIPYGDSVTVAQKGTLDRTGYSFAGWNTKADGSGISRAPGTKFAMGAAPDTLYAQWTRRFSITFNSQGGSTIAEQMVDSGGLVTQPANPALAGCDFAGWYKEEYCVNVWSFSSEKVTSADTLYAKWTMKDVDGNVYNTVRIGTQRWMMENLKVTKLNDGTAIPEVADSAAWANLTSPGYCWYGNNITNKNVYGALYNWNTIGTGKAAPSGWHVPTHMDWTTLSAYLGGDNIAGGKLKETGTAHWQSPNEGATNSTGFTALPGGIREYLSGYVVQGRGAYWWSSTAVDSRYAIYSYIYFNNSQLLLGNCYKEFGYSVRCVLGEPNQFCVTFNSQGGNDVASQFVNNGEHATEPTAPTRLGYTFAGWYKEEACTNVWNFITDVVTGEVTLYARWTKNSYRLSYNANGATAGTVPAEAEIPYGDSVKVAPKGTLDRTGYDFTEWNTEANGSGTTRTPGTKFAMGAAPDTLYAQWTLNTYTVAYNANNATGGTVPAAQTKTYGVTLTLAGNTGSLARTGYIFAGWNTAANGSGTDYAAGAGYMANEAVVLYAKWAVNNQWIELSVTGGPPTSHPNYFVYDAKNNRVISFFTANPSASPPGDTSQVWILSNANGLNGSLQWQRLPASGDIPANINWSASVTYDDVTNRLISYGGCLTNCGSAQPLVYVLTNANGLGGTPVWTRLTISNPNGQGSADHNSIYNSRDNLLIAFGGNNGYFGTDRNDVRALGNANGTQSPSQWSNLVVGASIPSVRVQSHCAYDKGSNRMIMFGGSHWTSLSPMKSEKYNDLWVLTNANGAGNSEWMQQSPTGQIPHARAQGSVAYDSLNNRLLLFGGYFRDTSETVYGLNDLWFLDNANGLSGAPRWTEIVPNDSTNNVTGNAVFDLQNRRVIVLSPLRVWVHDF